jgi:hypothetical protein
MTTTPPPPPPPPPSPTHTAPAPSAAWPLLSSAFYWQRYANEDTRSKTQNAQWVLAHLEVCEVASHSRWLMMAQNTEFVGNIAHLSICGPARLRPRLHAVFKRVVKVVFGPQSPSCPWSRSLAAGAQDDGDNHEERHADVDAGVED